MQMRIDELAQRADVPSRTIRYYTQQDLLPAPELHGRVGYYDERHLDRLRLIKELQEKRFLPLAVIRRVIRRHEAGADLDMIVAPLDMVFAPRWDAGDSVELTREQVASEAGVGIEVVDAAEDMGLLFPRHRGDACHYTPDDVEMVRVTEAWLELNLPSELGRLYRESLARISRMQVEAFNECIVAPAAREDLDPEEIRERLLDGYREMATTFDRLVKLLHRKLLQNAVESYAARD